MRIGGLATGMDIDSIVRDLMKVERMPLDKLTQKKQILEWQQNDYRDMNALLLSLREEAFTMRLSTSYRTKSVTTSDESKVIASATPSASNTSFSFSKVERLATSATKVNAGKISKDPANQINPDKSLWEIRNSFRSSDGINNGDFDWQQGAIIQETITVSEAKATFNLKETNLKTGSASDMVIKVDGENYEIVTTGTQADLSANQVLVDLANGTLTFKDNLSINSSISTTYYKDNQNDSIEILEDGNVFHLSKGSVNKDSLSVTVDGTTYDVVTNVNQSTLSDTQVLLDEKTGKLTFKNDLTKDSVIEATYNQNYFTFDMTTYDTDGNKVNEKFVIEGANSLNQVIGTINESNVGVSAFYDEATDQISLTREETGNFTSDFDEIQTSGNFLNVVLRFQDDLGNDVSESGGEDALFTLNGLTTTRHSNSFSINGVNFTLKDTFDDSVTGQSSVKINVATDTDKVYENIKKFIDKYNEVIGKINAKTEEKRYRDYKPLSDAEKEDMEEKQIELWEEKAKSGLLRSDSILTGVLSNMRLDFYQKVDNPDILPDYNQLAEIGITTTPNYLEGGKLIINESKLKKALEDSSGSVENLFTSTGNTESQKGIIHRLYKTIDDTIDRINEKAGKASWTREQYTMGESLDRLDYDIERYEDRLVQIEDRYWSQFTEMEKAIQKFNSQSMYLMQQFGSGA